MTGLGDYVKPEPEDPQNLAKRLMAEPNPMNKGIAMFVNAPALVDGYACAACGWEKTYPTPIRMERADVRRACCAACGSERITLRCKTT